MKDLKTPTTKCQRCGFNPDAPADGAHCSFCGRGPNEVKRLIAGPMVFICDECIEICVNALSGINPEGIPELVKEAEEFSAYANRELRLKNYGALALENKFKGVKAALAKVKK